MIFAKSEHEVITRTRVQEIKKWIKKQASSRQIMSSSGLLYQLQIKINDT